MATADDANYLVPPPSPLVKTLSNVSTTSTVTIDSAFSDSSTSPQSVSSRDLQQRGIPPKSPRSLPPLPSFNGRSRSLSTDSHRKRSPGYRNKDLKKSESNRSGMGESGSVGDGSAQSESDRLLRKLRKNTKRLGDKDPSVGAIYTALGNLHFREGRVSEAIGSYRNAIECREGSHTATACLNLGTAYWNQRNVPEATKYLKQALKALECVCARSGMSPDLNPEVASCHHQLGLVYAIAKDFNLAVYEIEEACRMRLAMYGPNHPMVARTMDAAGKIHTLRGDFDQALHCHEQALTILQSTPYATATLENIAAAHRGRGDYLACVHIYVEIVQCLKGRWHGEMTKSYAERNASIAQDLADNLRKLGDVYKILDHDAYADHCYQESSCVLMEAGIQPLYHEYRP